MSQHFESELANQFSAFDASRQETATTTSSESSGGALEGDGSEGEMEDESLVRASRRSLVALQPASPQNAEPIATREPQRAINGPGTIPLEGVSTLGAVGGDTAAATGNEMHSAPSNANMGEGEEPTRSALAATASYHSIDEERGSDALTTSGTSSVSSCAAGAPSPLASDSSSSTTREAGGSMGSAFVSSDPLSVSASATTSSASTSAFAPPGAELGELSGNFRLMYHCVHCDQPFEANPIRMQAHITSECFALFPPAASSSASADPASHINGVREYELC